MNKEDALKLENQICFPVYAASRLITRLYQPYLDALSITYPQYLVMMLLWEKDGRNVSELSGCLYLESNTLTPLLKRLETNKLVSRKRSNKDERSVLISLTKEGKALKEKALEIPEKVVSNISNANLSLKELKLLKKNLNAVIKALAA